MSDPIDTTEETVQESADSSMLVIDIGKKKSKQVRRLRKGRGRLAERIDDTIQQMKAQGALSPTAETVVVVVERKRKRRFGF